MNPYRKRARSAVILIWAAAALSWILIVTGIYADIAADIHVGGQSDLEAQAVSVVRSSRYLFLAAIALLVGGALWGRRRIEANLEANDAGSTLSRPAHAFSGTVVIIGLVFSVIAALTVFLESFVGSVGEPVAIDVRIWNTYVPIVLYTAVIVTAILVAFVFRRNRVDSVGVLSSAQSQVSTERTLKQSNLPSVQRATGLAFSMPIVAVALALILGLILYDVSRTAIQVWIWVLIQAFIAAGIIFGTWFSRRAIQTLRSEHRAVSGAVVGSRNLNFVLSVVFAALVAAMSLSYGGGAMEQLRVSPSLNISIYENEPKEPTAVGDEFAIASALVTVDGYDLKRQSEVLVTLEPLGTELISSNADTDGYFWQETVFPPGIGAGTYEVKATAFSEDSVAVTQSVPVEVTGNLLVRLPEGDGAFQPASTQPRLMDITANWMLSEVLPAFLLLLLAASVSAIALNIRNPEATVSVGNSARDR